MYGVARVVVTARQRDRLSSQQAARWPAKRHVKQPGLQVVETPMMAGATASGDRSARLARANPVVASMAGASVTVPRRGASSATPVRCSGAVLLRARRNGGSYTSQISAAKGARPRDGSPSTPATQLAQQTRAAAPLVPSFWPPQPPTAELGSAQPNCRIRQFTPYGMFERNQLVPAAHAHAGAPDCAWPRCCPG